MSKSISEVFDVSPHSKNIPVPPVPEVGTELQSDLDYAQANIRQLIEIGLASVKSASDVAEDSENPRAFEVVGAMIKSLTEMNLQLIQVHEKKQTLTDKRSGFQQNQQDQKNAQGSNITNNAIFVGTTKELNELIMKRLSSNV